MGTTLFMTVLAAWAAVLSRLSGQDEVVIGTPTANRGRAETEGLIGFFVNTLALRIQLGESPSVSELLSRVRRVALAAQEHQDLPFEQVVEIVQPPRRLNHTPIFQVILNWQNNEVSLPDFTGLQVSSPAAAYEVVRFDLELSLSELDEQIVGNLAYATALFDAARWSATWATCRRYCTRWWRQRAAGRSYRAAVGCGARLQLETWNATVAPYPQERCIHQLFEEQVRQEAGGAGGGARGARAELQGAECAGQPVGASSDRAWGRPDDRVAICVERSAAMVMGLLAILKAGGAYVPLDPAYPSGAAEPDRGRRGAVAGAHRRGRPSSFGRGAAGADAGGPGAAAPGRRKRYGMVVAASRESAGCRIDVAASGLRDLHLRFYRRPKGVAIEHRTRLICCAGHGKILTAEETQRSAVQHLAAIRSIRL